MADALPPHWNQKNELGGFDTTSKHTWAECIKLAGKKKLRLVRGQGEYKLYLPDRLVSSSKLDMLWNLMNEYQPPRAQR